MYLRINSLSTSEHKRRKSWKLFAMHIGYISAAVYGYNNNNKNIKENNIEIIPKKKQTTTLINKVLFNLK